MLHTTKLNIHIIKKNSLAEIILIKKQAKSSRSDTSRHIITNLCPNTSECILAFKGLKVWGYAKEGRFLIAIANYHICLLIYPSKTEYYKLSAHQKLCSINSSDNCYLYWNSEGSGSKKIFTCIICHLCPEETLPHRVHNIC